MSGSKNKLLHRSQRVTLDESTMSQSIKVTSGVPQDSDLSPYLFAAHIGSLTPTIPNADIFKYADDVIHAIPLQKDSDIDSLIQKQIDDTNSWCNDNGLTLNNGKTKVMMITKKGHTVLPSKEHHLTYVGHEIKFLGVYYNTKLNWTTHTT